MNNSSSSSVNPLPAENAPIMPLTTPAFMGYTEKAVGLDGRELRFRPTLIQSLADYEELFGKMSPFRFPIYPEDGGSGRGDRVHFELNGKKYWVEKGLSPYYLLYPSLKLYFENGGSECWIVSIGEYETLGSLNWPQTSDFEEGLNSLEDILTPHPTLVLAPDLVNLSFEDGSQVKQQMLSRAGRLQDRFVLMDLPLDEGTDHKRIINEFYTGIGNQFLSYGAAWYPGVKANVIQGKDCSLDNIDSLAIGAVMTEDLLPGGPDDEPGYHTVMHALAEQANRLPVSPAMAGLISRIDRTENLQALSGVLGIQGVKAPLIDLDLDATASLFLDTRSWKSVNPLKGGIDPNLVNSMGVRTISARDEVYGFISSRLIMTYVEKAIRDFLVHYAFELNNQQTWKKIETKVDAFLRGLWEDGLLFGDRQTSAWFVNIGLGTSMSEQDLNSGLLRLKIGLALAQPAEYVTAEFIQNVF